MNIAQIYGVEEFPTEHMRVRALTVMPVEVTTSPALRLSLAKPLFLLPPGAFRRSR